MDDLSVSFFNFFSVHECYIPPNIVKSLPLTSSISTCACVWASVLNPVHWASFEICSGHWALLTALGHVRYVSVVWLCVGISLNDDNLDLLEIRYIPTQLYIISWCSISTFHGAILVSQARLNQFLVFFPAGCYQHLLHRHVVLVDKGLDPCDLNTSQMILLLSLWDCTRWALWWQFGSSWQCSER